MAAQMRAAMRATRIESMMLLRACDQAAAAASGCAPSWQLGMRPGPHQTPCNRCQCTTAPMPLLASDSVHTPACSNAVPSYTCNPPHGHRDLKVYDRKVRKARAKANEALARRLLASKPGVRLDHLVRER